MSATLKPIHLIRLLWLEAFAETHGKINRADYMRAWQISPTLASKDFQELLRQRPNCMTFDIIEKAYLWTGKGKALDRGTVREILEYLPR